MTNRLLAPAPYARFQTSGGSYKADQKGVIAAAAIGDVIDLIRSGFFSRGDAELKVNPWLVQLPSVGSTLRRDAPGSACRPQPAPRFGFWTALCPGWAPNPRTCVHISVGEPAQCLPKAVSLANSAIRSRAIVPIPPMTFWRATPCRL